MDMMKNPKNKPSPFPRRQGIPRVLFAHLIDKTNVTIMTVKGVVGTITVVVGSDIITAGVILLS